MHSNPATSDPDAPSPKSGALNALVIDPSLFTTPYDEALVTGLRMQDVDATLVGRPIRGGEAEPSVPFKRAFYRWCDGAPKTLGLIGAALKALEHCWNGIRLACSKLPKGTVVHFQWLPFPLADRFIISMLKWRVPVIVTVHDTMPFNGTPTSRFQTYGFTGALRQADKIVVHTQAGKDRLIVAGLSKNRINVIPHGPLGAQLKSKPRKKNTRWTVVAFGKIRPYKGIDVLIDALATLGADEQETLRVIVAGEALMDLAPLEDKIASSHLEDCIDIRPGYLNDDALEGLFSEADAFVFPYREIEASGVLYLVEGLSRWIIASELGAFADAITDGVSGKLVPPEDADALGRALVDGALNQRKPDQRLNVTSWSEIARRTCDLYQSALDQRTASRDSNVSAVPSFQDTK